MKPTNIQRSILHELLYDVFQMFQMFQMFVYLNFPEFPAKYLFSIYTGPMRWSDVSIFKAYF